MIGDAGRSCSLIGFLWQIVFATLRFFLKKNNPFSLLVDTAGASRWWAVEKVSPGGLFAMLPLCSLRPPGHLHINEYYGV